MNKKQLIREVARITKFSIRLSKIIVNCCIKTILSELQQGHRISLKDFGAFHIVKSLGRTYFDIQKKEIKKSSAKNIVKFVPYKKFKKQLSTNVVDVHDENDGSIGNIITLEPRVFINPAPTPKKLNPNNSSPLSGKQNIGKRCKRKQDVAEHYLAFEGKFLYDKFQGELDHDSFPSVKVPQHDTSILIPKPDKTGTTVGVMEPVLLSSIRKMCQELNNIIVLDNVKLPILNRNYSYRPDVCLYWKERNIYVDIEVDEPYDIVSRKPIHYKGNGDNLRDRYFIRNGWCVIRFAESQIHKNIEGVTNYIKRMLRWLTNDESIKYDEDTLESVERWTYEQAEQMASDNAREHYLNLPDYVSTDDTQTNHVSATYDTKRLGFIKPDEDVLPPIEQSKWVSVIDKIAQINCDYCKVLKNDGYQWVYKNKQIKIVSHSGNEFIIGKSPLEYELEIPVDEIKDIVPMENLFSEKQWEYNPCMQSEDYYTMREILFNAIANGNPIWIAYDSNNSGYSTRFLSNLVFCRMGATNNAPHIGLGLCTKHGMSSLSHFYAYCSNRKEFRMFAADGRIRELKVLNCEHVYIATEVYERSFAKLIMSIYDNCNGNAFFENVDKILEYMPKRELDSPITQIKLADFHVLKGDIYSAMELYKKKTYGFFLTPSCTWGEACIGDIKFFIKLFEDHLKDSSDYYGFNAQKQKQNFEKVLGLLIQSPWMRLK